MENKVETVNMYEQLASVTSKMLTAALAGNWKQLIHLESDRQTAFISIQNAELHPQCTDTVRAQRICLIEKIMLDNIAISDIARPWLNQLEQQIASGSQQSTKTC